MKRIVAAVIAVGVLAGAAIGCFTTPKVDPCPGKLVCPGGVCCPTGYPFACNGKCNTTASACGSSYVTCSGASPSSSAGATLRPALRGVAFGGGKFVAVGDGGVIVTSPDGKTWAAARSGSAANLTGIAYGGSQFVAVGSGGTILTSSDGTTWTTRPGKSTENLNGAAFGNGVFVAVGWHLTIETSTDGVTWSSVYSGAGVWQDVAFTGTEFVAVNRVGGVIVSKDSATWTLAIAGNQAGDTGLCAVAGGPGGDVLALDYSAEVKLSIDASAASFSVQATLSATGTAETCDLADDGDTFVAAFGSAVEASGDGKTWTPVSGAPPVAAFTADGTHLVGVGPNGAVLNATCSSGTCSNASSSTVKIPEPPGYNPSAGSSGTSSRPGAGGTSGGACSSGHHFESACGKCCLDSWTCCTALGGPLDCNPPTFCD